MHYRLIFSNLIKRYVLCKNTIPPPPKKKDDFLDDTDENFLLFQYNIVEALLRRLNDCKIRIKCSLVLNGF